MEIQEAVEPQGLLLDNTTRGYLSSFHTKAKGIFHEECQKFQS
jgi:hypothetical protein